MIYSVCDFAVYNFKQNLEGFDDKIILSTDTNFCQGLFFQLAGGLPGLAAENRHKSDFG